MQTELCICLIKRDGQLLIKGFSYDRKKWYKLPKEYRPVNLHPIFANYKSIQKCMKQSKVDRLPSFRITKEIRANYINDNEEFVFKNKVLELDNNITEESLIQDQKSLMSSTLIHDGKRQRTSSKLYDITDIQSLVYTILEQHGKFELFKIQPEVYLSKIVKSFEFDDNTNSLDGIVKKFSKLLNIELHEWFFEYVFRENLTFEEFRNLFCERIRLITYSKMHNVHKGLDDYLSSLDLSDEDNKLTIYFDKKINFLQTCFNMNKEDARLLALSALEYNDYSLFLPVINDENSFVSLLKFTDKRKSIEDSPYINIDEQNQESESDLEAKVKELEKKLDEPINENKNLNEQNNELNSDIVKKDDELKAINLKLKDKDKEFEKVQANLNKKEDEIKKIKSDFKASKIKMISDIKDQIKSRLKLNDNQLKFLDQLDN